MVVRECGGGLVFYEDSVLLEQNDKLEWAFPKGVVRKGEKVNLIAVERVKVETGIDAEILAPCGKTKYEFYSVSRRKPVHNNVSWYVMKATNNNPVPNPEANVVKAEFIPVEVALKTITYSQDKTLLMMAYQKYKELT
ncbi:MAG: NUDIX domain-containing protein [Clostridia bacterium]|nr:NUDIX domain-containing protein [Clostridia bacterium]